MDTEHSQDLLKKAARERKRSMQMERSKMRSSCRENDTWLAKDRHQIILVVWYGIELKVTLRLN